MNTNRWMQEVNARFPVRKSKAQKERFRQYVLQKAQEMGYHPNLAARTLRTNRTYDIGVIFEEKTGSGLQHQYFATIFSSLQKAALAKGFEITFTGNSGKPEFDESFFRVE